MEKIKIQGNRVGCFNDNGSVGISVLQDLQELFLRYRALLENIGDDKALQDRLYIEIGEAFMEIFLWNYLTKNQGKKILLDTKELATKLAEVI